MDKINASVPAGFERRPDEGSVFIKKELKQAVAQTVSFRPGRGPGPGGPGRFGETEKAQNVKGTAKRLFMYFSAAKKQLLGLIAAVVSVTLLSLAAPAMQGNAIDCIKAHDWPLLYRSAFMLLGIFVVNVGANLAQSLLAARLSQSIVRRMRHDLFKKIDNLPIPYLDSHSNGDIMSRMTNDVENVSATVSQSLGSLISGVLTLFGTVTIMFIYCWQLTLVTMLSVILTVLVTNKMSKVMRGIYRRRSALQGEMNGHSEEMITGYRSIVAYNKQKDVTREFERTSDELTKVSIKAEILGGSMGPIMNCISNIGFVIVAAFGGYFAYTGLITIGTISAFIIYAKQFSRPINEIAQLYGSIQTAVAGAERVFALMDHPDENNSGSMELENTRGEISFRHVD
ncbi:MAG: ABC transporter ATP-binding protein, partial [Clostridia bacterium]|nr:ABC transporter ATP-binding protein [Clostridia bacterium]